MRVRLAALLPIVLLLALFLPVPDVASADTVIDTVVDEVDGLPEQDGVRAQSLATTTGAIRTPIEFSMLAFTAPPGAAISFRTSVDGHDWTPWTDAEGPEGVGPDQGTSEALHAAPDHRRSGEPIWVGEASWLQAKVDGAPFDDVQVDLIDSMGLSRSLFQRATDAVRSSWRGRAQAVAQAAGQPAIVTRGRWGADESVRKGRPAYAGAARFGVLHHTVGTNAYSREQAPGVVRGIYAYHTRSRGWSDIGYNFLVDRFGTIYEGRAGGMDRAVIGAHALGFNTGSIGVAMMGNHDTAAVPTATRRAVAKLLAWKFAEHGIDPGGRVAITSTCTGACKHPTGSVVTLPTLFAHRDVGYTACPGAKGYASLPGLRKAIRARQADVAFVPPFDDDDASVHVEGITALFERGITRGCTRTSFCPGRKVLRGQMASFLARTMDHLDRRVPATVRDIFADDNRSVHEDAINALAGAGIASGCSGRAFCPSEAIPRSDVAQWLAAALELTPGGTDHFADDDGASYEWAINALADAGLTQGCTEDRYCPAETTSRGQMASFLSRAIDEVERTGVAGT